MSLYKCRSVVIYIILGVWDIGFQLNYLYNYQKLNQTESKFISIIYRKIAKKLHLNVAFTNSFIYGTRICLTFRIWLRTSNTKVGTNHTHSSHNNTLNQRVVPKREPKTWHMCNSIVCRLFKTAKHRGQLRNITPKQMFESNEL